MLSIDKLKSIDPKLKNLSNKEIEEIRQSFYDFGQLIFEDWHEQKFGSKYLIGLLTPEEKSIEYKHEESDSKSTSEKSNNLL